ncbi:hypothetical protein [Flavobacterium sp. 5]|uniref:hypothetical protein n=1 Tax=Flavobacterium sp. 5 TaxID=2035199 RepID=UPI000CACC637|nr:hypothetical protein [Flavobacterium sp. 5]PKB15175.1 hypothetical protein CLU82_0238 [Flavobacterium sp. 5]
MNDVTFYYLSKELISLHHNTIIKLETFRRPQLGARSSFVAVRRSSNELRSLWEAVRSM